MSQTFVQSAGASGSSKTTINVTMGSAPTIGNLLVVTLTFDADPGAFTPPSGHTQIGSIENRNSLWKADFYCKNCPNTNPISYSWVNVTDVVIQISEYSGLDVNNPLEQSQIANGSSTTPTSASLTSTGSSDGLVCTFGQLHVVTAPVFSAPTNSFTDLNQTELNATAKIASGIDDRLNLAAGTYSTAVTSTANGDWLVRIIAFTGALSVPIQNDRMINLQATKLAGVI